MYRQRTLTGEPLTTREHQVMWLVAEGHSNKVLADKLGISQHTAKFHVNNACKKLGSASRTRAAVNFVLKHEADAQQRLAPLPSPCGHRSPLGSTGYCRCALPAGHGGKLHEAGRVCWTM